MPHTGRPTADRKGESIRIRLNDDMRAFVDNKARRTGKSVSEIFRDYVSKDMYSTYRGGKDGDRREKKYSQIQDC